MTTSVMWFRRDLRLSDNPALRVAIDAAESVVPLFVIDPVVWDTAGANRRWFLAGCLRDLDDQLDGRLIVRHGDPVDVVPEVARETDAGLVVHAADVGVYGRRRDDRVAEALENDERARRIVDSPWARPPGSVRTKTGGVYKVFTPYHRTWVRGRFDDPIPRPRRIVTVDGVETDGVPDVGAVDATLPDPGELAARRRVDRFLRSRVERYHEERDDPAADTTSRLSADLKFGTIHPRQLLARLDRRKPGHDVFAQELAWRDFYAQVLDEWPASAWSAWSDRLASIELDDGADADERFDAWCRGRTGYPLVDAGMRQLVAEGWMHNRLRMVTASFLVKDLHLDWTRGARYFLEHLVDGDLSSNNHGWQWVAGTGTDAAPYFRVFNPVAQSERFDPDGEYIRRWVPELADVDRADVHRPWECEGGAPEAYPLPIVDHDEERDEALRRYEAATD